jgi:hypothetical protein
MQRVGYDADTQQYSYRDHDGSYWEGAPGARYGVLHRSKKNPPSRADAIKINSTSSRRQQLSAHDSSQRRCHSRRVALLSKQTPQAAVWLIIQRLWQASSHSRPDLYWDI